MKLSYNQKLLLLFLTILPYILTGILLYNLFGTIAELAQDPTYYDGAPPGVILLLFSDFLVLTFVITIISLGLTIYYIVHATKDPSQKTGERVIWILLFIFIGSVVQIIYYIVKVWPDKAPKLSLS